MNNNTLKIIKYLENDIINYTNLLFGPVDNINILKEQLNNYAMANNSELIHILDDVYEIKSTIDETIDELMIDNRSDDINYEQ